jgi:ADP-ribosyl-[dinitrogen reductase] hydrolase
MRTIERYRGCLLGLAVGDALGAPFEGSPPGDGSSFLCEEMLGGGPFHLEPGEWTDDTSMALCLAESLIERRNFDPLDQLERYVRWMREGRLSSNGRCFDIGGTVHAALRKFLETRQPYCGSTDPTSAGNGSIMRLAPVPLFYANNSGEAIERCGESSRTTHAADTAVDACRYLGGLIVGAIQGASREELLGGIFCPVSSCWDEKPLALEVHEIAGGSFRRSNPPDICASGYVVKSLEAALWAFHRSSSFRDGCLYAVSLGLDADTTGAVYGQLAGAFYGESAIPESWLEKLAHRRLIESVAERLFNLANSGFTPRPVA